TGAQNTSEEFTNPLRACIDWVQVTFKDISTEYLVTRILGLDFARFNDLEVGQYGYRRCLMYGNIMIYYDGRPDMGIHLQMSGQGCRQYESYDVKVWSELFRAVFYHKSKFSRLDVAIDDFKPYFEIPKLIEKIKNRELVSKFKDATRIEKIDIESGESKGNTIYYGSPQSRIQIRMYEKDLERAGKGFELEEGIEAWNRTEIQARNERAQKIAGIIASNENGDEEIGQVVRGILSCYLDFKDSGKDSNRSRWKTSEFWESFLGGVQKLRLTDIAPDRTVERSLTWVDNQVTPTLAMLALTFDEDVEVVHELIKDGVGRLTDKEYKMIEAFREKKLQFNDVLFEIREMQMRKRKKVADSDKSHYFSKDI
ncbi:replication initiation factor domain-containing protein, partial [Bacillus toyonensis]|uniref:replication initiation factor domain-containing protein n=1 Tax=Bacillus toyonensis TaxID=155322 RepID=UPI001C0AF6A7